LLLSQQTSGLCSLFSVACLFKSEAAIQSGDILLVDFGTTIPSTGNYNIINSGSLSVTNLVRSTDGAGVGGWAACHCQQSF